jgi:arginase family enzyme
VLALNVDAHFDVRADSPRNSGTPYRQLLEEGKLKVPRIVLNRGGDGLEGALQGIDELRANRVSGEKLVYTL